MKKVSADPKKHDSWCGRWGKPKAIFGSPTRGEDWAVKVARSKITGKTDEPKTRKREKKKKKKKIVV